VIGTQTQGTEVGFGHLNILTMVWRMIYGTAAQITGIVGLPPIAIAYAVGGLLAFAFLVQIYGAVRGRTSFSLEPVTREDQ